MKLIFERRNASYLMIAMCLLPILMTSIKEKRSLGLPNVSETEISRHYTKLSRRSFGVNCGFYPLGSCTMKYNPKINDEMAKLPVLRIFIRRSPRIRCRAVLRLQAGGRIPVQHNRNGCHGFSAMQAPSGEFTGLKLIWAYHGQE